MKGKETKVKLEDQMHFTWKRGDGEYPPFIKPPHETAETLIGLVPRAWLESRGQDFARK